MQDLHQNKNEKESAKTFQKRNSFETKDFFDSSSSGRSSSS